MGLGISGMREHRLGERQTRGTAQLKNKIIRSAAPKIAGAALGHAGKALKGLMKKVGGKMKARGEKGMRDKAAKKGMRDAGYSRKEARQKYKQLGEEAQAFTDSFDANQVMQGLSAQDSPLQDVQESTEASVDATPPSEGVGQLGIKLPNSLERFKLNPMETPFKFQPNVGGGIGNMLKIGGFGGG